jgi:hypothetical protein
MPWKQRHPSVDPTQLVELLLVLSPTKRPMLNGAPRTTRVRPKMTL